MGIPGMPVCDGDMTLRLFRPAEVVSDVILPKMNSFELCKVMVEINNNIPVFRLKALGTTNDKLERVLFCCGRLYGKDF